MARIWKRVKKMGIKNKLKQIIATVAAPIILGSGLTFSKPVYAETQKPVQPATITYQEGKQISLEKELNIDLVGDFDQEQLNDISDVLIKVRTNHPNTGSINLRINMNPSALEKKVGASTKYDPKTGLHTITMKPDCANKENTQIMFPTFKGTFTHEYGHTLTQALGKTNDDELYKLIKTYLDISKEAKKNKTKFTDTYHPGFISIYALHRYPQEEESLLKEANRILGKFGTKIGDKNIDKQLKKYEKHATNLKNYTEINNNYRIEMEVESNMIEFRLKLFKKVKIQYFRAVTSDDLAESFTYLTLDSRPHPDPLVQKKQEALTLYLDEVWGISLPGSTLYKK